MWQMCKISSFKLKVTQNREQVVQIHIICNPALAGKFFDILGIKSCNDE